LIDDSRPVVLQLAGSSPCLLSGHCDVFASGFLDTVLVGAHVKGKHSVAGDSFEWGGAGVNWGLSSESAEAANLCIDAFFGNVILSAILLDLLASVLQVKQ
jgi:hypothetical protein